MRKQTQFITYKTFIDKSIAEEFAKILKANDIEAVIELNANNFDVSFAYNQMDKQYAVKINNADYEKARQLLISFYEKTNYEIDKSHFVYLFSNDELIDMLVKIDEWDELDIAFAKKMLTKRRVNYNTEEIKNKQKDRLLLLAQKEKLPKWQLFLLYFLAAWDWFAFFFIAKYKLLLIIFVAFMGGAGALMFSWYVYNYKKVLPNGMSVNLFGEKDRIHALIVSLSIVICLLLSFIFTLIKVISYYSSLFVGLLMSIYFCCYILVYTNKKSCPIRTAFFIKKFSDDYLITTL